MGVPVADWVDERVGAGATIRWFLWRKVPKGTDWFSTPGFGALCAFGNQAVTGVFLAMYYRPDSAGGAYESIRNINDNVFLGQFVHGMHKWGASVMIIFVFLHMGVNFFFGAYKYPRELTWVIGVVLLVLTLIMGFTGYLLPFDQRSYWATIVGVNFNAGAPLIGPVLSDFLFGGADFGATTLSRFYAIHMMIIPGAIVALVVAHLYLVVKLGTTAPPWIKAEQPPELTEKSGV
jgi:menaquinol-cytochrome c reductase cytochrome b subunit